MDILKFIIGLFTGKAGEAVGGAVSSLTQIAALIAAVTPLALWFSNNKNEVFITLTYADLAFWGTLGALQLFLVIRLVHRAPPPTQ